MAERPNILARVRKIDKSLRSLETYKQKMASDIVDIVEGNQYSLQDTIPSGQGLVVNVIAIPADNLNHILRYLWSMEVVEAGQIGGTSLEIDYTIPSVSDTKEVASFASDVLIPMTPVPFKNGLVECSDGVLVSVFIDNDGSVITRDLYYCASSDNGATWTAPTKITTVLPDAIADSRNFDIDIDSNDDIFLVYNTGANNQSCQYRKLTRTDTTSWSIGSEQVTDQSVAGWPSVAVLSNNSIVIGYTHYNPGTGQYRYKYRKSTDGGTIFGGATEISNPDGNIILGRVVRYTSGKFMAVYYKHGSTDVYYSINGNSENFGWDQPKSALLGNWSIVRTTDNRLHAIIYENTGGPLTYRRWDGSTWSAGQNVSVSGITSDAYSFSLTAIGTDLYLRYYESDSAGIAPVNINQRIRSGGSWGSATTFGSSTVDDIMGITATRLRTSTDSLYVVYCEDSIGSNNIEDFLGIARQIKNVEDSLTLNIEDTADNGYEEDDTSWIDSNILIGEDASGANVRDSAFRFNNITIPQGVTINSAKIVLIGDETSSSENVDSVIKGIKEANAGALNSSNRPSQRSKTTASVNWTISDRTQNVNQESPDIASIIEEIVGQSSWVSGNSLILVIEDDGNTDKEADFQDYTEFVSKEWYEVLGDTIDLNFWPDLETSNESNGQRGFYWVIDNLTANQITIGLSFKAYVTWQSGLTAS